MHVYELYMNSCNFRGYYNLFSFPGTIKWYIFANACGVFWIHTCSLLTSMPWRSGCGNIDGHSKHTKCAAIFYPWKIKNALARQMKSKMESYTALNTQNNSYSFFVFIWIPWIFLFFCLVHTVWWELVYCLCL